MAQTGLLSFAQAAHLLLVYEHSEGVFLPTAGIWGAFSELESSPFPPEILIN
jgi:hypothetical protein